MPCLISPEKTSLVQSNSYSLTSTKILTLFIQTHLISFHLENSCLFSSTTLCVCVCVCLCVCVCVCACVSVCMCVCERERESESESKSICVCIYVCMWECVCVLLKRNILDWGARCSSVVRAFIRQMHSLSISLFAVPRPVYIKNTILQRLLYHHLSLKQQKNNPNILQCEIANNNSV